MATPVEPIGSPQISRVTSGTGGGNGPKNFVMQWINRGFIFSVRGGLHISVVITGLLCVILLGSAMSHSVPTSYAFFLVTGYSYYAFLFIVSFWCFMTSVIILITSSTSVNTASTLPKSTFYIAYHGAAATFYLFGSLALLAEGAKFEGIILHPKNEDLKPLVFAGGSIGIIVTVLYVVITVFGVRIYRKS